MGLTPDNHSKKTFINIVGGKFAKRVAEGTDGAVERTIENDDGSKKKVWELIYRNAEGNIDSLHIDEAGKYGDQLQINMSEAGESFCVNISLNSREAKSFLCCLPNIRLKQSVILMPFNFTGEGGKQVSGLNIYQGVSAAELSEMMFAKKDTKQFKVLPLYSKDNLNGMPAVPEGADKDEFKLAMGAQAIFLKKKTKLFIAENFGEKKSTMQPNQNVFERKNAQNDAGWPSAKDAPAEFDDSDVPF